MTAATGDMLAQREALFGRLVRAYLERDFATIDAALRPDVVLHLPGYSPFAGEHRGHEAVGRFILGLRQFLESDEASLHFEHTAGMMHASQQVTVHGPSHLVEMGVRVTVEFDDANRVAAVFVQPSDLGLFDHVIGAALLDQAFGL